MFRKPSIQALPAAAVAAVPCFLLAAYSESACSADLQTLENEIVGKQEFQTFGSSGCDTLRDLGDAEESLGAALKNSSLPSVFLLQSLR